MSKKIFLTGSSGYIGTKFVELYGSTFNILTVSRNDVRNPVDLHNTEKVKQIFEDFKPDFIVHLAADTGRDITTSSEIITSNPAITQNLIDLALPKKTPFLFTSTEAVYGGKENGNYAETDNPQPRSPYGESKVICEKLLMKSKLPYLITRGHRHVGISNNFASPKHFPDALRSLLDGKYVSFDSKKLFTPVLINNVCDILVNYIIKDSAKQIILNLGIDTPVTYYQFMHDVAERLGINGSLVKPDGNEAGWPDNNSLSIRKLHALSYPSVTYQEMLEIIKSDAG